MMVLARAWTQEKMEPRQPLRVGVNMGQHGIPAPSTLLSRTKPKDL